MKWQNAKFYSKLSFIVGPYSPLCNFLFLDKKMKLHLQWSSGFPRPSFSQKFGFKVKQQRNENKAASNWKKITYSRRKTKLNATVWRKNKKGKLSHCSKRNETERKEKKKLSKKKKKTEKERRNANMKSKWELERAFKDLKTFKVVQPGYSVLRSLHLKKMNVRQSRKKKRSKIQVVTSENSSKFFMQNVNTMQ